MFMRFAQWIDRNLLSLGREMRLSYLPPLMVYMAYGISGLTGIVGTFVLCSVLIFMIDFVELLRQSGKYGAVSAWKLAAMAIAPPRVPVWSNVTAAPYPADADGVRALIAEQVAAPPVASPIIEQVAQLAALRDAGALTADEFDLAKAALLARM